MPASLTLNEIRSRALAFSKEWKGETSESAEKQTFWNQFFEGAPEVSVKASALMAKLHLDLLRNGYAGVPLAVFLVRLMFCLFADHTGLFPRNLFRDILERKTRKDGSDVGSRVAELFAVLDQPEDTRQKHLDEDLKSLPYVNGHLFQERFDPPAFDTSARKTLLKCCSYDWSGVSPAIFGAMFQMVMDEVPGSRRAGGAHYTSEKNILKTVSPLLIDPLRAEFEKSTSKATLEKLLERIRRISVLDPACGCGNFLVIAYRELRQLEIDINRKLQQYGRLDQKALSVLFSQGIEVDAMYGIEIEEFPCRVAETALYLVDHQMNMKASEEFGENYIRLPLRKSPHITHANSMGIDWARVVPAAELTCIVGNPPFVGKKFRTPQQTADMEVAFGDWEGRGELDYVATWYVKAIQYIKGTSVTVAFVSTNSISQGEQVCILWPRLMREGLTIHFAHRTFRWTNDAPGQAAVFCVIVGWSLETPKRCLLFDYETPKSEPMVREVNRINAYLVDADDVFVYPRRRPLCGVPSISFGNMPNDGGHLLLTSEEKEELIGSEPEARKYIRRIYGSKEFINNIERYCLWLVDAKPSDLRRLPLLMKRVERVRAHREASSRPATNRLAETPTLFGEIRQPRSAYLAIPKTSSEGRRFIPMGYLDARIITTTELQMVEGADLYHFGVLASTMHMAWVRQVCGRLKSDFRYSNEIVYNNFPWPEAPSEKRRDAVRRAAQNILNVRAEHEGQSLADLYNPDVMPPDLIKAHRILDRAVDGCYRTQSFENELARVRFLFERYRALTTIDQLPITEEKPRGRRR